MTTLTGIERLDRKIEPEPNSGCWVWVGARKPKGYGNFYVEGLYLVAHRVVYEQLVGPIPDGLTLDHTCRNRSCVNPRHLEPTTMHVNILRGQGWAGRHARQTHCQQGHAFDESNTRAINNDRQRGGRECRACCRERDRQRWPRRAAEQNRARRLRAMGAL